MKEGGVLQKGWLSKLQPSRKLVNGSGERGDSRIGRWGKDKKGHLNIGEKNVPEGESD